uniref:Homeobox domain-containing protein n=1 Tax=Rhabditophanes sp. KR3021 TaxID=114890 RepID=A0AC35U808_9BILA
MDAPGPSKTIKKFKPKRALDYINDHFSYSSTNIFFWTNNRKGSNPVATSSSASNLNYTNESLDDKLYHHHRKRPEESGRYERSPLVIHSIDARSTSTDYWSESYKLSSSKKRICSNDIRAGSFRQKPPLYFAIRSEA